VVTDADGEKRTLEGSLEDAMELAARLGLGLIPGRPGVLLDSRSTVMVP
jgi:hypothetical protein